MRRLLVALAVVPFLGIAGSLRSADADTARAVLEKAIQAEGGADKLARLKAIVRTAKGELSFGGAAGVPATCEATLMPPEHARWSFELEDSGRKIPLVLAVNGGKSWRSGGGVVKDMTRLEAEEPRAEVYVTWLTTLLPLRDAGFQLSPLAEIKVADMPAVGIKVARKGSPDVKLYFDKQNGLLVKAERKGKEAGITSNKEYFFGDYREYGGLKLPTRHIEMSNGKKMAEWTITGYKFPGRIEEKEFAKP